MTGAVADCERILAGAWGQPINALSAAAYLVAAITVWRRSGRAWVAAALAATGIGSILFHGPMPIGAQWLHDVTLIWLLVVVGTEDTPMARWGTWPSLVVLGLVVALLPASVVPLGAVAGIGAVASVLARDRSRRVLAAVGLLALGVAAARLGATGGPWCDPGSLVQPHAAWHLLSAAAVATWAGAWASVTDDGP